jgi:hypothetical protein
MKRVISLISLASLCLALIAHWVTSFWDSQRI